MNEFKLKNLVQFCWWKARPRFAIGLLLLLTNSPVGWGAILLGSTLSSVTGEARFAFFGVVGYALSWLMLFAGLWLAGSEGVTAAKGIWRRKRAGAL